MESTKLKSNKIKIHKRYSKIFDSEYYISKYKDISDNGITKHDDAFEHYKRYGIHESRKIRIKTDLTTLVNNYTTFNNTYLLRKCTDIILKEFSINKIYYCGIHNINIINENEKIVLHFIHTGIRSNLCIFNTYENAMKYLYKLNHQYGSIFSDKVLSIIYTVYSNNLISLYDINSIFENKNLNLIANYIINLVNIFRNSRRPHINSDKKIYIGRLFYSNKYYVGQVDVNFKSIRFMHKKQIITKKHFELLQLNGSFKWSDKNECKKNKFYVSTNNIIKSKFLKNSSYVVRVKYNNMYFLGELDNNTCVCRFLYNDNILIGTNYELLTVKEEKSVKWINYNSNFLQEKSENVINIISKLLNVYSQLNDENLKRFVYILNNRNYKYGIIKNITQLDIKEINEKKCVNILDLSKNFTWSSISKNIHINTYFHRLSQHYKKNFSKNIIDVFSSLLQNNFISIIDINIIFNIISPEKLDKIWYDSNYVIDFLQQNGIRFINYCNEKKYKKVFLDSNNIVESNNEIHKYIPKNIFLTNKSFEITPFYIIFNLIKINPGYEIFFFDDEKCCQFLEYYFNKDYALFFQEIKSGPIKSDFWRLCVLYIYGGVYLDIDLQHSEKIDDILSEDRINMCTVLGQTNDHIFQAFLASSRRNNILRECINLFYTKNRERVKKMEYNEYSDIYWGKDGLTGTFDIYKIIKENLKISNLNSAIYEIGSLKVKILEEYIMDKKNNVKNEPSEYVYNQAVKYNNNYLFKSRYDTYDMKNHTFF